MTTTGLRPFRHTSCPPLHRLLPVRHGMPQENSATGKTAAFTHVLPDGSQKRMPVKIRYAEPVACQEAQTARRTPQQRLAAGISPLQKPYGSIVPSLRRRRCAGCIPVNALRSQLIEGRPRNACGREYVSYHRPGMDSSCSRLSGGRLHDLGFPRAFKAIGRTGEIAQTR